MSSKHDGGKQSEQFAQTGTNLPVEAPRMATPATPPPDPSTAPKGKNAVLDEKEGKSRILLILPGRGVSFSQSANGIFAAIGKVHGLFYRCNHVHEVLKGSDGRSSLSLVTGAQFRSRLERFGRVVVRSRTEEGEPVYKSAVCSNDQAKVLLQSEGARQYLPPISVLSSCPIVTSNNGVPTVLGPGWHALANGTYVTAGQMPPVIPLQEAVPAIQGLLEDFDFTSPGDRSRAFASLLSPALRLGGWLNGMVPVDFSEADASQSGKTYRGKVQAALYNEVPNIVVFRNKGVGSFDESLSQKLIDGRPFILMDNLRGELDSSFLESIITAPGLMPARVPYRPEVQVDTSPFQIMITSNGLKMPTDLGQRLSIVRIRKRPLGHPYKSYPEGDLHMHVIKNQAYYLGCVFSIIQDWARRGQPRTGEIRHSFREWAQILDWIVQNTLGGAPLLDGHTELRNRATSPHDNWLRSLLLALRALGSKGAHSATELAGFARGHKMLPPGVRGETQDAEVARIIGKIMSSKFGPANVCEVDAITLTRTERYSASAGKKVPVYEIG